MVTWRRQADIKPRKLLSSKKAEGRVSGCWYKTVLGRLNAKIWETWRTETQTRDSLAQSLALWGSNSAQHRCLLADFLHGESEDSEGQRVGGLWSEMSASVSTAAVPWNHRPGRDLGQARNLASGSFTPDTNPTGIMSSSESTYFWNIWVFSLLRMKYWEVSGFPWWLSSKESACQAGVTDSFPGSGKSPGEGIGNPLQYSCLENPMYRGAWRATAHGVVKTRIWLSDLTITTLRCLYISDAAFNGFVVMSIYVSVNSNRKWVHPRPRSWLCLPHLSSVCLAQWPAPSGHSVHFSWVNQQMTHPMKVPTWQSSGIEPCEPRRAYSRWWSSRRDQFLSLHQLFSSQR